LSKAEEQALRELYRRTQNADIRTRCQMILLSAQEHAVSEIACQPPKISTNHK